jgi:hypothetical protein
MRELRAEEGRRQRDEREEAEAVEQEEEARRQRRRARQAAREAAAARQQRPRAAPSPSSRTAPLFVPFENQCRCNPDGSPRMSKTCDGREDAITAEDIAEGEGCCAAGSCYGDYGESLIRWIEQEERQGRVPRNPGTNQEFPWLRASVVRRSCPRPLGGRERARDGPA